MRKAGDLDRQMFQPLSDVVGGCLAINRCCCSQNNLTYLI